MDKTIQHILTFILIPTTNTLGYVLYGADKKKIHPVIINNIFLSKLTNQSNHKTQGYITNHPYVINYQVGNDVINIKNRRLEQSAC